MQPSRQRQDPPTPTTSTQPSSSNNPTSSLSYHDIIQMFNEAATATTESAIQSGLVSNMPSSSSSSTTQLLLDELGMNQSSANTNLDLLAQQHQPLMNPYFSFPSTNPLVPSYLYPAAALGHLSPAVALAHHTQQLAAALYDQQLLLHQQQSLLASSRTEANKPQDDEDVMKMIMDEKPSDEAEKPTINTSSSLAQLTTSEEVADDNIDESNRFWSTSQINEKVLDAKNVQVSIYLETRDSGPRTEPIVESELYSSIKYEMRHEIKNFPLLNEFSEQQLFCRIQIIHPDNKTEVLKNGKTILTGVIESNVSRNVFEAVSTTNMKIKFTDCSYHHGNCSFAFRVSYFIESDLENPILVLESAAFKVLARKPSKNKKPQAPKRKRKEEEEPRVIVDSPQQKLAKISNFDDFKQVTNSVFDYIQSHTDEQKKRQMINLVITKLYSVDPNIVFSLPTDDGSHDIFKSLL